MASRLLDSDANTAPNASSAAASSCRCLPVSFPTKPPPSPAGPGPSADTWPPLLSAPTASSFSRLRHDCQSLRPLRGSVLSNSPARTSDEGIDVISVKHSTKRHRIPCYASHTRPINLYNDFHQNSKNFQCSKSSEFRRHRLSGLLFENPCSGKRWRKGLKDLVETSRIGLLPLASLR